MAQNRRRVGVEFIAQQPVSLRTPATALMNHLAARTPQTRAEIMDSLGWSRTTLSRIVSLLMDGGLLNEEPGPAHGRGRPVSRLSLNPAAGRVVGIDIGFRSIRTLIAAVDHSVVAFDERSLSEFVEQDEALEVAREMIDALLAEQKTDWAEIVGAGIAVGAPIERGSNAVALGGSLQLRWRGDLLETAARHLPCPSYIGNDSRLSAHAEMLWGAGRDLGSFLYLKLHSGTGGSLVLDRRIVTGSTGAAGEVGHVIIDPDGLMCRCGNRGCLETVAGVPALLDSVSRRYPQAPTWADFRGLLADGDATAVGVMEGAFQAVGLATASLVNVFNPEAVVLGGALSRAYPPGAQVIQENLRRHCLPVNGHVDVRMGAIDRRAGALGAVGLVLTHGVV
ncbi:ROK family transcriptional regulator [Aeromicrobium ginsengisoli]|uniref:ROK family transcriptional regulator n=1 Tax=Aeromicrobium ginsengisoli TaxID=363867 RepID=A0A5M4FDQ3_9ACTN|nr:ROK family transcriptional regulator [Aeromicrobium ginsengisoli]KAA1397465.1 ROK family transcriptional regulator [Aeromicrobium ginsengisoli]